MTFSADQRPERGARGPWGLYVHVPFCSSLCSYCHFVRTADHDDAVRTRYVEDLLLELRLRSRRCGILSRRERPLATVYLGGGTPSLLEPELIERLVAGTVATFPHRPDLEMTIEANPESFDDLKAGWWRELGINRVSLGIQSLQPRILKMLGRAADPAQARAALRRAGRRFDRVSADWILGPALRVDELCDELDEAVDLGVKHFSLYILEVHTGTMLAERVARGQVRLPQDEDTERVYLAAGAHLEKLGFNQYEVANFARPGAESRHNQAYWSGRPYLGLGPGAHSFWGRRRSANVADPAEWSRRLAIGSVPEDEVDPLDRTARRLERIILALRTAAGVPLDWLPGGALDVERGCELGWWTIQRERLVLTRLGFLRIDGFEAALATRLDV